MDKKETEALKKELQSIIADTIDTKLDEKIAQITNAAKEQKEPISKIFENEFEKVKSSIYDSRVVLVSIIAGIALTFLTLLIAGLAIFQFFNVKDNFEMYRDYTTRQLNLNLEEMENQIVLLRDSVGTLTKNSIENANIRYDKLERDVKQTAAAFFKKPELALFYKGEIFKGGLVDGFDNDFNIDFEMENIGKAPTSIITVDVYTDTLFGIAGYNTTIKSDEEGYKWKLKPDNNMIITPIDPKEKRVLRLENLAPMSVPVYHVMVKIKYDPYTEPLTVKFLIRKKH